MPVWVQVIITFGGSRSVKSLDQFNALSSLTLKWLQLQRTSLLVISTRYDLGTAVGLVISPGNCMPWFSTHTGSLSENDGNSLQWIACRLSVIPNSVIWIQPITLLITFCFHVTHSLRYMYLNALARTSLHECRDAHFVFERSAMENCVVKCILRSDGPRCCQSDTC